MIKLLVPLPKQITIACSGGVDSMAAVDFLSRKHDVTVAFYHHGTKTSDEAMEFVAKYCTDKNIPVMYGMIHEKFKPKDKSLEEHWREYRYKFLENCGNTVVTAHHLDDSVETYLWGCLHGTAKVPEIVRGNVVRPFLTTPKQKLIDWCVRKNVPWIEDKSNNNTEFTRNYIRKELMPHALTVNPGLHKVIKKIIEQKLLVDTLVK
jgi:tRNA(Ile)-lysidine synthase